MGRRSRKDVEEARKALQQQYEGYSEEKLKEEVIRLLKLSKSLAAQLAEDTKLVKEDIAGYNTKIDYIVSLLDSVKREELSKEADSLLEED